MLVKVETSIFLAVGHLDLEGKRRGVDLAISAREILESGFTHQGRTHTHTHTHTRTHTQDILSLSQSLTNCLSLRTRAFAGLSRSPRAPTPISTKPDKHHARSRPRGLPCLGLNKLSGRYINVSPMSRRIRASRAVNHCGVASRVAALAARVPRMVRA